MSWTPFWTWEIAKEEKKWQKFLPSWGYTEMEKIDNKYNKCLKTAHQMVINAIEGFPGGTNGKTKQNKKSP